MSTTKHLPRPPRVRGNLRDHLQRGIERELLNGPWVSGDRLPGELEWCAKLGASRPMVREALQSLKARGVIESRRGSGSYLAAEPGTGGMGEMMTVCSALAQDAPAYFELFDLRLMVETFCVRRITTEHPGEAAAHLGRHLQRMKAASGDIRRFGRADIDFHLAMVRLARHRLFDQIMKGLMRDLGRRFAAGTYTDQHLVARTLSEHGEICRWVASGNAARAAESLTTHLEHSRKHLEQLIGGSGVRSSG